MAQDEDSAVVQAHAENMFQPQLNGDAKVSGVNGGETPSDHKDKAEEPAPHNGANGTKRKSEDRDEDPITDAPLNKSPKLQNAEHAETSVKASLDTEINNSDRYWNRDPLSPLRDDDKQRWPGFREIETDPEAFESMLRMLGARGLAVRHVFGLDIDDLLTLPQPIVGFLFCFRHRGDDETNQIDSCPDDIWFANQTHRWLCGSNSLINIIFNIPHLTLGEHLEAFKEFTRNFTPAQRGEAVGNYDFLRQVHNSCLRKMEILLGDVALMEEYSNRKPTKKAPTAEEKPSTPSKGKGKGKIKAKPKQKKKVVNEDAVDDDAAYHYAAYLPIQGNIWKLDGLDRQPSKLDQCDSNTWLAVTAKILFDRISEVDDEAGYSILAICREDDKLKSLQTELAGTISMLSFIHDTLSTSPEPHGEQKRAPTSGIRAPHKELGITQHDLDEAADVPAEVMKAVTDSDWSRLRAVRDEVMVDQNQLVNEVRREQKSFSEDEEKMRLTRHDYEPLIRTWLEMLGNKEGIIREIVESLN